MSEIDFKNAMRARRIAMVILIALISASGGLFTWIESRAAEKTMYESMMTEALMLTASLDKDKIAKLTGTQEDLKSPDYHYLRNQLIRIRNANPKYRYLYMMGKHDNQPPFFFMGTAEENSSDYSPPGQVYFEDSPTLNHVFAARKASISPPFTDRWGTWISALIPITDTQNKTLLAVFGMDFDAGDWQSEVLRRSMTPVIITLLSIILLVAGIGHISTRQLSDHILMLRQAESALRESEERLRDITEVSFDGIFIHDKGSIIDMNVNAIKYMGYSKDEIIGKNLLDLIAPDYRQKAAENLNATIENPEAEYGCVEIRFVSKSGETFDIEYFSRKTTFDGKPVRVVAFRDITQRKSAEKTLSEREFRFRSFYNSNPEGIILMDFNGKITDVNKTLMKMGGYTMKEIVHRHFTEFIPESYHSIAYGAIFSIKTGILLSEFADMAYIRKNGEVLPISVKGWRITDEASQPVSLGVFVRDLSKEKRLTEEKMALEKQLLQTQKMEAIGTLAGGIAHDFNNILGGIIGYTELALIGESPDPKNKTHGYLTRVLQAGNRAKDLVRQLLRFSRRDETITDTIAIAPIVRESVKLLRSTLPATIRIEKNIQAASDTITGDSTQIHQVIMNLCTNAYHAMRDTGGVLSIALEKVNLQMPQVFMSLKAAPGEYLKLSISDTGCGIEPQILERVFEPYFTTKKVNEGTGLGLSVTLGIVKAHNGLIDMKSVVGKGTCFDLYFPLSQKTIYEKTISAEYIPVGNHEHILIVDDELFFLDAVRSHLEYRGYRVSAMQSSLKAIETFKENPDNFDLLITDQTMPEMTGVQLIEEIRKHNNRIPIILCTGYSETVTEQTAEHYGIAQFMMKPVTTKELAWAVCKALESGSEKD